MKGVTGMITLTLALGASALAVAGGSSATIGAGLPFDVSGVYAKLACNFPPHCVFFQEQAQGGITRAPFNGSVRSWKLTEPNGTFRLAVVRKVDSDSWKLIRWTGPRIASSENGSLEIVKFKSNLKIRRGDRTAIVAEDFGASTIALEQDTFPGSCRLGLVPGPFPGETGDEVSGYSVCSDILLYNAKVVR